MSLCPKLHHMKTTETRKMAPSHASCSFYVCVRFHLPLSLHNVNKIIQVSILIPREHKHPNPVENTKNIHSLPSQNIYLKKHLHETIQRGVCKTHLRASE